MDTTIQFCSPDELSAQVQRDRTLVIVDETIRDLHPRRFDGLNVITLRATEHVKTLATIEDLYRRFQQMEITRHHTIYAVGGGIITDIAGFAAATWKRGCNLALVPTTLLAMVDAAVGGKNGVNFGGMKNAVGTFYNPQQIVVIPEFLKTLQPLQRLSGIGEIVKMALLDVNPLYEMLSSGINPTSNEVIRLAIERKMHYVTIDPHDRGERAKLNLGHTFGHLIESASEYTTPHGIAVAIGIRYAARYSREMGWLHPTDEARINELLDRFELPIAPDDETRRRIERDGLDILRADKKRGTSHLKLICFNGFHSTFVHECTELRNLVSLFSY